MLGSKGERMTHAVERQRLEIAQRVENRSTLIMNRLDYLLSTFLMQPGSFPHVHSVALEDLDLEPETSN